MAKSEPWGQELNIEGIFFQLVVHVSSPMWRILHPGGVLILLSLVDMIVSGLEKNVSALGSI